MKHHLLIADIRDTSFHVHWAWLVMLGLSLGAGLHADGSVAVLLGSYGLLMVIHEAGHALLARCCHCVIQAMVLHPLHGRCVYRLPADGLDALREAVIAWGGILAQALLLVPVTLGLFLWGWSGAPWLNLVLLVWGPINGVYLLLQLLPVGYLDGARAWQLVTLLHQYRVSRAPAPPPELPVGAVMALTAALEPDTTDLYHMLWLKCLYDESRVAQLLAQEQRRHPQADRPELLKIALRRFDRKLSEDG